MAEIGRTAVRPAVARLLAFVFLAGIAAAPLIQQAADIRDFLAGRRAEALPRCYDIFRKPPGVGAALARRDLSLPRRIVAANRNLMRAMRAYEEQLENDSIAGRAVRAPVQLLMARGLGAGNEQVYCGRGPWLFYRPEIEFLTGSGFLDPGRMARRIAGADEWQAPPQPDPIKAILHFRDQLAQRGIALIVMPVPAKPMIHPEKFVRAYAGRAAPLANASSESFAAALRQAGVLVFDAAPALSGLKRQTGQSQYLAADTHWRPEAAEHAARQLALFIAEHTPLPAAPDPGFKTRRVKVRNDGDTALMLKLPAGQTAYPPETVVLRQVLAPDGGFFTPDKSADVLVLGDSFGNIYSLASLGWGESAGLVEQLGLELKRPLDRIALNDNGAFAARQALARELGRGRDRLAGKRLVIYQFAARELAVGDWKLIELAPGPAVATSFLVPPAGAVWPARGTVKAITSVPRPGSVPYKDHVLTVHLADIACRAAGAANGQAVVYMQSMRDNEWTPAAHLQPGDAIAVRLRPWSDAAARYEGINRTELDDLALQLQEPCWGELDNGGRARP